MPYGNLGEHVPIHVLHPQEVIKHRTTNDSVWALVHINRAVERQACENEKNTKQQRKSELLS